MNGRRGRKEGGGRGPVSGNRAEGGERTGGEEEGKAMNDELTGVEGRVTGATPD